ncbi:MAG: NADP-dependent oxidoreductase [Ideonella sp. WA131b]|jgi:NADPH-dependent curcumin reductase CurA|nr:NADP-dependent oxidoreductase [Ideonella sp. WA131b]
MATLAMTNRQVRLAARPLGLPKASDWTIGEEPLREPAAGEIRVRVTAISLDPAMRGWMNEGKSYIAPVGIGEVMRAGGVGVVEASRHPAYAVGDAVSGSTGVQTHWTVAPDRDRQAGLGRIDLGLGTPTQWLNVLGMPGMTAYFGLMDVGLPNLTRPAGETLVVSGAAGAVGQTVGQLARIKGLRVVGIAGGAAKCEWVVRELGFDACIDYKGGSVKDGLKAHCPEGVDIYFDNVGGEILDTVLTRINRRARIVICGAISQYNNTTPVQGPKNYLSLLVNRARMEGMVVFDYAERYHLAVAEMAAYLKDGRMKSREDVASGGVDAFPATLNRLFSGDNFGKLVLSLQD